jgi:hypothetical protein
MELPSESYNSAIKVTPKSTVISRNKKWFDDNYISRINEPIIPNSMGMLVEGSMCTFTYDAKFKDKLDFWDFLPRSLILQTRISKKGVINVLALNVSYIPPQIRLKVLDKIVKTFNTSFINPNNKKIENEQFNSIRNLPLQYDVVKKILSGSGFEFAIRSYLYNRLWSTPLVIPYTDWWRVATVPSNYLHKMTLRMIYYRYKKNLDEGYKLGRGEKQPDIKNTKIKDIDEYLKKRYQ